MKKFIYYSTIFSIFTEAFLINIGFDLKLFYFFIFINTILLFFFDKIVYSYGLLIFHFFIIITGFYSCFFGYNDIKYFLVQLFFLLLIPIYYFNFFKFYKPHIESIVVLYCKTCFILAIYGFLLLPYDVSLGRALHSILLEPAHYCTIVLPAYFITLKDKKFPRYYFVVIVLSIIVSGSSLGFMGLGLSMILYAKHISFYKIIISAVLVSFIGMLIYISFPPFKLRLDDTVNSAIKGDVSNANLSTYALLSNFYVSKESLMSNPLIGNGIGSHINSRNIYLGNLEGIEYFESMNAETLNAQDAGSLFSRVMSELGLLGLFGLFYFIIKFYVSNTIDEVNSNAIICKGILLYFFAKLFREGHYFSPEMYFFVFLYMFNKYETNAIKILKNV